jgi:hypothetical protein
MNFEVCSSCGTPSGGKRVVYGAVQKFWYRRQTRVTRESGAGTVHTTSVTSPLDTTKCSQAPNLHRTERSTAQNWGGGRSDRSRRVLSWSITTPTERTSTQKSKTGHLLRRRAVQIVLFESSSWSIQCNQANLQFLLTCWRVTALFLTQKKRHVLQSSAQVPCVFSDGRAPLQVLDRFLNRQCSTRLWGSTFLSLSRPSSRGANLRLASESPLLVQARHRFGRSYASGTRKLAQ